MQLKKAKDMQLKKAKDMQLKVEHAKEHWERGSRRAIYVHSLFFSFSYFLFFSLLEGENPNLPYGSYLSKP